MQNYSNWTRAFTGTLLTPLILWPWISIIWTWKTCKIFKFHYIHELLNAKMCRRKSRSWVLATSNETSKEFLYRFDSIWFPLRPHVSKAFFWIPLRKSDEIPLSIIGIFFYLKGGCLQKIFSKSNEIPQTIFHPQTALRTFLFGIRGNPLKILKTFTRDWDLKKFLWLYSWFSELHPKQILLQHRRKVL